MKFTVTDSGLKTWKQIAVAAVAALGLIAESLHEIAIALSPADDNGA